MNTNKVMRAGWMVCAATAILASTNPAIGQDGARGSRGGGAGGVAERSEWRTVLDDLVFEQGTASEYVNKLEQATGTHRVVAMPGVNMFQVPDLHLSRVEFESALMILDGLQTTREDGVKGVLTVRPRGRSVMVVQPKWDTGRHSSAEIPQTSVWTLAGMTDAGIEMDDIITAVKTAIDTTGREAVIRVHSETSLLILRGTQSQLQTAKQVLNSLEEGIHLVREQDNQHEAAEMRMRMEMEAFAVEMDRLNAELADTQDHLARAKAELEMAHQQLMEHRQEAAVQITETRVRLEHATEMAERYHDAFIELQRIEEEEGEGGR